jgi:hypothetical protein
MDIVVIKDEKALHFSGINLRDGGLWAKTPKGDMPMCDSSLLKSKGLDPVLVAKKGQMEQHPDCWLKLGQNPGGSFVYLAEDYRKFEEASRLEKRDAIIQSHILAATVKLQRHEYSFPEIEWYLCYGEIQQRIYPENDIRLSRVPDEKYLSGIRWILTNVEYQQLVSIPTTKLEPQYELTESTGIPAGVDKICEAENAWHRAQSDYERAYEREEYAPCPSDKEYQAAIAAYPRAALYLKSEAYIAAANDHKAMAGEQAKDLLVQGGKTEDIEAILTNWLPPSAYWD